METQNPKLEVKQAEIKKIKKVIENKIDEFVDDTFPASDPPAWDSLRHLEQKAEKLANEE